MLQKKNDNYLTECSFFHFAGCCEVCVHFDGDRKACSFFWPNEAHLQRAVCDRSPAEVSFCKDFELN